jgi:hypothetical protein
MPESKYHLRVNVGFRIDAALDRLLAWRRRPGDPGIAQRRAGCPSLAVSWGIQDPEKPTTDHISARVPLSDMSEAERKAYVIADNAIALKAGWDEKFWRSRCKS